MEQGKNKHGGARPGAGRKPLDLGEKQVNDLVKAFKKAGKDNKSSAGQELARIAFSGENDRVKLKALDIYYRAVAVRKSHSTIDDKRSGPSIGLPPMKERPAKLEDEQGAQLH
ncbi:MAG: hypothetical protein Q7O12_14255 [Deltaproteobacteria bacterium]|nr:hypothetical protein [Deltaproteobacteria bacterium]